MRELEEVHLEAVAGTGAQNVWRVLPRARIEHAGGQIGGRMNVDRYLPSAIRESLLGKLQGSDKVPSVLSLRGLKKLQELEKISEMMCVLGWKRSPRTAATLRPSGVPVGRKY